MRLGGETLHSCRHYINGTTRWGIPITCTFMSSIFQALIGDRNWATISIRTKESGATDTKGDFYPFGIGGVNE